MLGPYGVFGIGWDEGFEITMPKSICTHPSYGIMKLTNGEFVAMCGSCSKTHIGSKWDIEQLIEESRQKKIALSHMQHALLQQLDYQSQPTAPKSPEIIPEYAGRLFREEP